MEMHRALWGREETRLTDEDEEVDSKTKACEGDVGVLYSWSN